MSTDEYRRQYTQGVWLATATYTIWGLFPFYFNLLKTVSALEILFHRILWTAVFTLLILVARKQLFAVLKIFIQPRILLPFLLSAFVLATNWGLYIYGIVLGDVLQLSLAYFINPLFNVIFGVIFFKEHLGLLSKIAIALALSGVLYRAFGLGGVPVLAITIAIAFSLYGVLRKRNPEESIRALFIESSLVLPFIVLAFILFTPAQSLGMMASSSYWLLLFLLAGPVTSIPLIGFNMTVKRIPYYLVGLFQYIVPTLLFLSAIFIFNEAWTLADLATFGLVWAGIVLVVIEQVKMIKRK